MIIGPGCLMNAFYLFLSYCSLGSSWWAGTGTLFNAQTELLAIVPATDAKGVSERFLGAHHEKVSEKERQRLEKATSSLFPWGPEAQGGAGRAGVTRRGSGRDVDLVSWPRTKPLSPAFKASVERGQAMDSVHGCRATHTPSWSFAQRSENTLVSCEGVAARAGCISDSWLFSAIQGVIKSAIFIGSLSLSPSFIFSLF